MSHEVDGTVKVEIENVKGEEEKYDAWHVRGRAWIKRPSGDEVFEKTFALNVLKDEGHFKSENGKPPKVVKKARDLYVEKLKEDERYNDYVKQSLKQEKKNQQEVKGEIFEL